MRQGLSGRSSSLSSCFTTDSFTGKLTLVRSLRNGHRLEDLEKNKLPPQLNVCTLNSKRVSYADEHDQVFGKTVGNLDLIHDAADRFVVTLQLVDLARRVMLDGVLDAFIQKLRFFRAIEMGEEHHEAWLTNQAGKEVLIPFPGAAMQAWPISPRVNSPKNNDADLLVPVQGTKEYG